MRAIKLRVVPPPIVDPMPLAVIGMTEFIARRLARVEGERDVAREDAAAWRSRAERLAAELRKLRGVLLAGGG